MTGNKDIEVIVCLVNPIVLGIWFYFLSLGRFQLRISQKGKLLLSSFHLRPARVEDPASLCAVTPHKKANGHPRLNPEDIVGRTRQFGILPHIATEIDNPYFVKLRRNSLSEAIKRQAIEDNFCC